MYQKFTTLICLCAVLPHLHAQNTSLDLDEAVVRALENRYTIRIGRVAVEQADAAVVASAEPFETTVALAAEGFRDRAGSDPLQPLSIEGSRSSIEVNKQFTTGTRVGASVLVTDPEDVQNGTISEGRLDVAQSLLRGRSRAVNRAPIRIASHRLDLSREALRQHVMDTLVEVHFAYFDVVLAEENARVAKESLELASQLLDENRRRAEVGSLARSDILQADTEVAVREDFFHSAETQLQQARNRLKQLLTSGADLRMLDWQPQLQPLEDAQKMAVAVRDDYAAALQRRPDYRAAILNLDIARVEQLRASDQTLPDVELYARMRWMGRDDGLSSSLSRMVDDGDVDYIAGVRIERSFSNRASRAQEQIAGLQRQRLTMTLSELEQAILYDLADAAVSIEQDWKRLESARRARQLAEQSVAAEQQRFQTGTSSTFVLIRLQTDLVNARIRELVAETEYRKAVIRYQSQTAEILENHAIEL